MSQRMNDFPVKFGKTFPFCFIESFASGRFIHPLYIALSLIILICSGCGSVILKNRTPECQQTASNDTYKFLLEVDPQNTSVRKAHVYIGENGYPLKNDRNGLWSTTVNVTGNSVEYHFRVEYLLQLPPFGNWFTNTATKRLPEYYPETFQTSFVNAPSINQVTLMGGAYPSSLPALLAHGDANGYIYIVWWEQSDYAYFNRALMADAQFGTAVNLGNSVSVMGSGGYDIAATGPYVYVAVPDWPSGGAKDIFLAISSDYGENFSAPVNVSNSSSNNSYFARVSSEGSAVYAAWLESTGSTTSLRFRASSDNGNTFGTITTLSNDVPLLYPALETEGEDAYISICDENGVSWVWHYTASSGTIDTEQLTLDGGSSYEDVAGLAVSDEIVYAVWNESNGGSQNLMLAKKTENVSTFTPFLPLENAGELESACVAADGTDVYIAWTRGTGVYLVRNERGTFHNPITLSSGGTDNPQSLGLSVDGGHIHVIWKMGSDIYHRYSSDGAHNFEDAETIASGTTSTAVLFPVMQCRGADSFIAWRSGNALMYRSWRLRP